MDVTVLMNPKCEHRRRIEDTIGLINRIQTHFRLSCETAKWLPNDINEEELISGDQVHAQLARRYPRQLVIAITQSGIDPENFVDEPRQSSLIPVGEWESNFPPPPLKIYVMFEMASALLN